MRYLIICLTALLLLGGVAEAQNASRPPRGAQYRGLGLAPDQIRKVQDLHRQLGPRMRELEKGLSERREALESLYGEFTLDANQARHLNQQINSIQREILEQHMKLQVELRKILTAEQFGRLRVNMDRRRPMPLGRIPRPAR